MEDEFPELFDVCAGEHVNVSMRVNVSNNEEACTDKAVVVVHIGEETREMCSTDESEACSDDVCKGEEVQGSGEECVCVVRGEESLGVEVGGGECLEGVECGEECLGGEVSGVCGLRREAPPLHTATPVERQQR